ncbi:Dyp-type peroxidase [Schizopora paradoxa]|uniref:Dyp-type peroxidase n=1 Tax=Schizopora paradoxa TaxID=27342 RepID=A0A0H2RIX3_9AGAM|nr:Dyp-type peroxidase [Schizopora paradoxa]
MAQQPLPTPTTFPTPEDLKDLQGELGFPKRAEDFVFFTIQDVAGFKQALKQLQPLITSTADVQAARKQIDDHKKCNAPGLLKIVGTNIAFSAKGLTKLGVTESLGDADFAAGQLADAQNLGDTGTTDSSGNFVPDWLPQFKSAIDGILLIAGDSILTVEEQRNKVELVLGKTINAVLTVNGLVRPGKEKGHEHFGFLDGVSLPGIQTLTGLLPGQQAVDPGVLVLGQNGDTVTRPAWAKNGSFLAYRQLNQLVPEFNKFLNDNPLDLPGLTRPEGSELLGARLVGRWKSGAPIDITPLKDDPALGADPQRRNNFDFSDATDQSRCPFSAHIRKTNPRTDLPQAAVAPHQIMRQGIAFGPEVTLLEAAAGKTAPGVNRGLAFVCYQSAINQGFSFLQHTWANNINFPPKPTLANPTEEIGFDPIIGQNGGDKAGRVTIGQNPNAQSTPMTLPVEWVVSKGGEYFFSPPISALTGKLAA